MYSDSKALANNLSKRNSPYAESTPGAPYGLPNYSYVLGNAGNKKGTASGDVYYIAVDSNGSLYGGAQVNNATDITWKETATKDDLSKTIYKSYSNIVIDSSTIPNYAIIDSFANMGVPSEKQVTGLCVRGWQSGTGYFQVCKTSDGKGLVLVAPAGTFGQLGVEVTYK